MCLDGSSDEYLNAALLAGRMPNLQRMCRNGFRGVARGAIPSFTNVNNAAIITGAPPSVHGLSGNYFYNQDTGEEEMMNSSRYLRAPTILAEAASAGRKVGIVTAKEKLRDILSNAAVVHGAIAISSETYKADGVSPGRNPEVERALGLERPEIYSGDASIFVLKAGAELLEKGLSDFLYLSTTDFIQHKFEPEAPEAITFYEALDVQLGRILEAGALVGITADHGMNAKQRPDGSPEVVYLEEVLENFGFPGCRVILPITDPYVLHHGALGSFAIIHVPASHNPEEIARRLRLLNGVTEVYGRDLATLKLELPADRIGDLAVLSGRNVVLGKNPRAHDLKAVSSGLRSHGGRYEEMVPFIFSERLSDDYHSLAQGDTRNFDVFDFTINGLRK